MMPVLRYFMVMGCCLVGLLFAVDLTWPGEREARVDDSPATFTKAASAESGSAGQRTFTGNKEAPNSIDNRRYSEQRFERTKQDPRPVVYPNVATLAPTPDRLQWERQLRYLPADHVYQARAEMTKQAITDPVKPAVKTATRKHLAHTRPARIAPDERPRYARNTAWDPFGLFD